jgi:hypothetical protein
MSNSINYNDVTVAFSFRIAGKEKDALFAHNPASRR